MKNMSKKLLAMIVVCLLAIVSGPVSVARLRLPRNNLGLPLMFI